MLKSFFKKNNWWSGFLLVVVLAALPLVSVFSFDLKVALAADSDEVYQGALDSTAKLKTVGVEQAGYSENSLIVIIGKIIQIVLGLLGVVLLVLILYVGFLWITSGGEANKIAKAKQVLLQAVIGLFIVSAAFALTTFILSKIEEAAGWCGEEECQVSSDPGGGQVIAPPGQVSSTFGFLSSVPQAPVQLNTELPTHPLNCKIQASFDHNLKTDDSQYSLASKVAILNRGENGAGPLDNDVSLGNDGQSVRGEFDSWDNYFTYQPELAGKKKFVEGAVYQVEITTGDDGLKANYGSWSAESSLVLDSDFLWKFKAEGGDFDNPYVVSFWPENHAQDICRQTVLSITFSKLMLHRLTKDGQELTDLTKAISVLPGNDAILESAPWPIKRISWQDNFTNPTNPRTILKVELDYSEGGLAKNTDYTVTLSKDYFQDLCDNGLSANDTISFTTNGSDNLQCQPVITELKVFDSGSEDLVLPEVENNLQPAAYGQTLELSGYYFTSQEGRLFYGAEVFDNKTCFAADFLKNDKGCDLSWSDNKIRLTVPPVWFDKAKLAVDVGATALFRKNDDGQLVDFSGNLVDSETSYRSQSFERPLEISSPQITEVSPNPTYEDQLTSFSGRKFGAYVNSNLVRLIDPHQTNSADFTLGCGGGAGSWSDGSIKVKLPTAVSWTNDGSLELSTAEQPVFHYGQVLLASPPSRYSNLIKFEIFAGDPGPGVCWLIPREKYFKDVEAVADDVLSLALIGEKFEVGDTITLKNGDESQTWPNQSVIDLEGDTAAVAASDINLAYDGAGLDAASLSGYQQYKDLVVESRLLQKSAELPIWVTAAPPVDSAEGVSAKDSNKEYFKLTVGKALKIVEISNQPILEETPENLTAVYKGMEDHEIDVLKFFKERPNGSDPYQLKDDQPPLAYYDSQLKLVFNQPLAKPVEGQSWSKGLSRWLNETEALKAVALEVNTDTKVKWYNPAHSISWSSDWDKQSVITVRAQLPVETCFDESGSTGNSTCKINQEPSLVIESINYGSKTCPSASKRGYLLVKFNRLPDKLKWGGLDLSGRSLFVKGSNDSTIAYAFQEVKPDLKTVSLSLGSNLSAGKYTVGLVNSNDKIFTVASDADCSESLPSWDFNEPWPNQSWLLNTGYQVDLRAQLFEAADPASKDGRQKLDCFQSGDRCLYDFFATNLAQPVWITDFNLNEDSTCQGVVGVCQNRPLRITFSRPMIKVGLEDVNKNVEIKWLSSGLIDEVTINNSSWSSNGTILTIKPKLVSGVFWSSEVTYKVNVKVDVGANIGFKSVNGRLLSCDLDLPTKVGCQTSFSVAAGKDAQFQYRIEGDQQIDDIKDHTYKLIQFSEVGAGDTKSTVVKASWELTGDTFKVWTSSLGVTTSLFRVRKKDKGSVGEVRLKATYNTASGISETTDSFRIEIVSEDEGGDLLTKLGTPTGVPAGPISCNQSAIRLTFTGIDSDLKSELKTKLEDELNDTASFFTNKFGLTVTKPLTEPPTELATKMVDYSFHSNSSGLFDLILTFNPADDGNWLMVGDSYSYTWNTKEINDFSVVAPAGGTNELCLPTKVEVLPPEFVFKCVWAKGCPTDSDLDIDGNQVGFSAQVYSGSAPLLNYEYNWELVGQVGGANELDNWYTLTDQAEQLSTVTPVLTTDESLTYTASQVLAVTATNKDNNNLSLTADVLLKTDGCVAQKILFEDLPPNDNKATYGLNSSYCQDGFTRGQDVLQLDEPSLNYSKGGTNKCGDDSYCSRLDPTMQALILSNWRLDLKWCPKLGSDNCFDAPDSLFFRVLSNKGHLSPRDWYFSVWQKNPTNAQDLEIDGYQVLQVGSTYYLTASYAEPDDSDVHTNMYVLAVTQPVTDLGARFAAELIENIWFNKDQSLATRYQLARDTKRIITLADIQTRLYKFKQANKIYPKLFGNSKVLGVVSSAWESEWNNFSSLLRRSGDSWHDPQNVYFTNPLLVYPGTSGGAAVDYTYQCGAKVNQFTDFNGDVYQADTCWNQKDYQAATDIVKSSFDTLYYRCPVGAKVFNYQANYQGYLFEGENVKTLPLNEIKAATPLEPGNEYLLNANFEVVNKVWQGCSSSESPDCPFDQKIWGDDLSTLTISADSRGLDQPACSYYQSSLSADGMTLEVGKAASIPVFNVSLKPIPLLLPSS